MQAVKQGSDLESVEELVILRMNDGGADLPAFGLRVWEHGACAFP